MRKVLVLFLLAVPALLAAPDRATADCTIGVAHGDVTIDGRPILWKSRMWSGDDNIIVRETGPVYDFIGIKGASNSRCNMGLNTAGLAVGNSLVSNAGGNWQFTEDCLGNCATVADVRAFIANGANLTQVSGCFPFIDAEGNATMFEIRRLEWMIEYDCLDEDRDDQGMLGWVVRANEFHQQSTGIDDLTITGRYMTGRLNTGGLIGINELSARTIMQGNDGANDFEFMRYGPGRPLDTIALSNACASMAVHGVGMNENPALTTMWAALGKANYAIAVPTWALVEDIPACLASETQMTACTNSLYIAGNEPLTQASVFPAEAHLYAEVDELMATWRNHFDLAENHMSRVESRMAADAYSLLVCLDSVDNDNLAPTVGMTVGTYGQAYVYLTGDRIAIEDLTVAAPPVSIYHDDFTTNQVERDSYSHSVIWPEMAIPPAEPYLTLTRFTLPPYALAFDAFEGRDAHVAYRFKIPAFTTVRPFLRLATTDQGHGHGAYSLSPDGRRWTFPQPLSFGGQDIGLVVGPTGTRAFQANAADADGTIASYQWNFGDGYGSTAENPSHAYRRTGYYLVSCTVTDDDDVSTTDWDYIYVYVRPADIHPVPHSEPIEQD